MAKLTYFGGDGSYGSADYNFALIDTQNWTQEQWEIIEATPDHLRAIVALDIHKGIPTIGFVH